MAVVCGSGLLFAASVAGVCGFSGGWRSSGPVAGSRLSIDLALGAVGR